MAFLLRVFFSVSGCTARERSARRDLTANACPLAARTMAAILHDQGLSSYGIWYARLTIVKTACGADVHKI
jgi:hypothetical protein